MPKYEVTLTEIRRVRMQVPAPDEALRARRRTIFDERNLADNPGVTGAALARERSRESPAS